VERVLVKICEGAYACFHVGLLLQYFSQSHLLLAFGLLVINRSAAAFPSSQSGERVMVQGRSAMAASLKQRHAFDLVGRALVGRLGEYDRFFKSEN
jgi:hypothetical protein